MKCSDNERWWGNKGQDGKERWKKLVTKAGSIAKQQYGWVGMINMRCGEEEELRRRTHLQRAEQTSGGRKQGKK